MSDAFTPQVRALLDRLEPPPLTPDFADRLVARAETTAALPPLPPLRKPHLRRGRRVVLGVGLAGLLGVAAAAAVVPADAWRRIPVIGGIVELIDPAPQEPATALATREPEPIAPEVPNRSTTEPAPHAAPGVRPVAAPQEASAPAETAAIARAPGPAAEPTVQPEPVERSLDTVAPPAREIAAPERPVPVETREAVATVAARPVEPAPERLRPADTAETRQQIRERTAATRQAARERLERRERRASRTN